MGLQRKSGYKRYKILEYTVSELEISGLLEKLLAVQLEEKSPLF
jgi:hypothetical protein